MGELGTEICADKLPDKRLEEDGQIKLSVENIAQAACYGNRQDNHHAGADSLYQGHAEDNQERELDKGSSADAECARDKAVDGASEDAVDVQLFACQKMVRKMKQRVEPLGVINL